MRRARRYVPGTLQLSFSRTLCVPRMLVRSEDDGRTAYFGTERFWLNRGSDAGASSKARERRVMKQRDIRDEGPIGPAQGAGLDRAVRTCNFQFSFSSTLCVPAPPAREGLAGLRSLASKRIRAGPPADVIVIANRATKQPSRIKPQRRRERREKTGCRKENPAELGGYLLSPVFCLL